MGPLLATIPGRVFFLEMTFKMPSEPRACARVFAAVSASDEPQAKASPAPPFEPAIRGLKHGLTEDERYAVADHVVAQLKEHDDPWRLDEEAKPGRGHST